MKERTALYNDKGMGRLAGRAFDYARRTTAQGTAVSDKDFILKKILDSHKAVTETRGRLAMSAFELICGNRRFPITNISGMAIHGPANLVFNVGGDYYELRPGTPQCARKYYALYNKLREIHQRRKHMQTNGI